MGGEVTGVEVLLNITIIHDWKKMREICLILGKKVSDGKSIGVKGRLTNTRIDTFQNFYGLAIKKNKGNPEAMSSTTMAILDHMQKIQHITLASQERKAGVVIIEIVQLAKIHTSLYKILYRKRLWR